MSDRIISCPSCDCKIRIVMDGSASKWGCGTCKQHFEMSGETPILIAVAAPASSQETVAAQTPNRFPPPAPQKKSGGAKVVMLSIAGFCAFLLAFAGAFYAVSMLTGGARSKNVNVVKRPSLSGAYHSSVRVEGDSADVPSSMEYVGDEPVELVEEDVEVVDEGLPSGLPPAIQKVMQNAQAPIPLGDERATKDVRQQRGFPPDLPPGLPPELEQAIRDAHASDSRTRSTRSFGDGATAEPWVMPTDVDGMLAELPNVGPELQWQILFALSRENPDSTKREQVLNAAKPFLTDSSMQCKNGAAKVVLHWGDEEHNELIWQIARSDNLDYVSALKKLKEMNDPDIFRELVINLRIQNKSHTSMRLLKDFPKTEEILIKAFDRSSDENLKKNVLQYLGKNGTDKCVPFLKSLVEGDDKTHTFTAQLVLATVEARIGMNEHAPLAPETPPADANDLEGIITQLEAGQHSHLNMSSLTGRHRNLTPKQIDRVIKAVTPLLDKQDNLSLETSFLIMKFGEARHGDAFWKIAKSDSPFTQRQALEKLLESEDPKIVPHLIAVLKDPRQSRTAASLLSKAKNWDEQLLIDAFDDLEHLGARVQAVSIISAVGTQKSVPLLKSLLDSEDGLLQSVAKGALKKIESRSRH